MESEIIYSFYSQIMAHHSHLQPISQSWFGKSKNAFCLIAPTHLQQKYFNKKSSSGQLCLEILYLLICWLIDGCI